MSSQKGITLGVQLHCMLLKFSTNVLELIVQMCTGRRNTAKVAIVLTPNIGGGVPQAI